ncbi:MAG: hypothetical protein EHM50_11350, partial [Lysobacterales bacterium]
MVRRAAPAARRDQLQLRARRRRLAVRDDALRARVGAQHEPSRGPALPRARDPRPVGVHVRRALTWLLALCCALALYAALGWGPTTAHAEAGTPSTVPAYIRGLAPLPGDRPVPLADRPPGAFADDGGPSPVIFPPQQLTIRFNHKKHVKELKLTCTTCHDKAKKSKNSADNLLPKATRCDGCHLTDHENLSSVGKDGDDVISQCGFCHIGYKPSDGNKVARMSIPKPNLKMDHAVHLKRNIGCAQCHGSVENIELATRDQLPRMRGCFGCHQMPEPARGEAKGECKTCHLTER